MPGRKRERASKKLIEKKEAVNPMNDAFSLCVGAQWTLCCDALNHIRSCACVANAPITRL